MIIIIHNDGNTHNDSNLVGGFNPSEKYESNWESSISRGGNKKIFENNNQ